MPASTSAAQQMPSVDFDVAGARQAGYSDAEIADYLGQRASFNAPAARKAGYDDGEIIQFLSHTPKPAPEPEAPKPKEEGSFFSDLGKGLSTFVPALKESAGGLQRAAGEAGPITSDNPALAGDQSLSEPSEDLKAAYKASAEQGAKIYKAAAEDIAQNAPEVGPGGHQSIAYQLGSAVAQIAPIVAVGFLTRNPELSVELGANMIGAEAYGQKFGEAREEGRTQTQASVDAGFTALVQSAMARVPLGVLMKPGGTFLRKTLETAGAGGFQGIVTQALQEGYDAGIIHQDMPTGEAVQRVMDAGIVGGLTGGVLGAGEHGVSKLVPHGTPETPQETPTAPPGKTPEQSAAPVMAAPTVDAAIQAAQDSLAGPIDIEAMGRTARMQAEANAVPFNAEPGIQDLLGDLNAEEGQIQQEAGAAQPAPVAAAQQQPEAAAAPPVEEAAPTAPQPEQPAVEQPSLADTTELQGRVRGAARRVTNGPVDAATLLALEGGIRNDEGHDLVNGRGLQQFVPGAGPLIRPNGMSIDYAGELLHQHGYFGPPETTPRPSENDVLQFLEGTRRNDQGKPNRLYTPEDQAALDEAAKAKQATEDNARALQDVHDEARALGETLEPHEADQIVQMMGERGIDPQSAVVEHLERKAIQEIESDHGHTGDQAYAESLPHAGTAGEIDLGAGEGGGGPETIPEGEGGAGEAGHAAPANPEDVRALNTERGAEGFDQTIIAGAEHAARQLAQAREARGHGRIPAPRPQAEAGGMFAPKLEETSDMFAQQERAPAPEPAPEATEEQPEEVTAPTPAPSIASVQDYQTARGRFVKGELTAAHAHQAFESVIANKAQIRTELMKMTKPELEKLTGPRYRNDKKDAMVRAAYDGMLNGFNAEGAYSYSMGEGPEVGIRNAMAKQTDETISKMVAARKARTTEMVQTYTNPQTAAQFRDFVRVRGRDALTDEQRARYDNLVADQTRATAAQEKERAQVVKGVDAGVSTELVQTKHTQKGHDLFVVKMAQRVERDVYDRLNQASHRLGGRYSSYAKDGAVPGFQFRSREAAEKFMEAAKGSDVSKADIAAQRQEEVKDNAVERLRAMADSMTDDANESLSADRKVNTARRASMAAGAEADAQAKKALATTMRNIADAIEGGDVRYLDAIRTRADVETLGTLARRAQIEWARAEQKRDPNLRFEKLTEGPITPEMIDKAPYPYPNAHRETALDLARTVENKSGYKRDAVALRKMAEEALRRGDWLVRADNLQTQGILHSIAQEVSKGPFSYRAADVLDTFKDYGRLQRMGLSNPATMRAALREFLQYRGSASKADPIKAAERALVGSKIPGYFPTPPRVVDEMLSRADIRDGMSVLEPSAGKGNILDRLNDTASNLDIAAIEPHSSLRHILELKGANVVDHDFLQHEGEYDRIVMNPPFEHGQDIDHVRHAYDLLKPGGKLVAIMSEGPFYRSDAKAEDFRNWLDTNGGEAEKLPQGSFLDSERSTGVATRLVVVDKPGESEALFPEGAEPHLKRGATAEAPSQAKPQRVKGIFTPEFDAKREQVAAILRKRLDQLGLRDIALKLPDAIITGEGRVDGAYAKKIIAVALEALDHAGILDHEAIHALRSLGLFNKSEWKILEAKAVREWRKLYKIDERYGDLPEDKRNEEAIAEAFKFWREGKLSRAPDRLFDKVRNLLTAVGNALRLRGFRTGDSIFSAIDRGAVGGRDTAARGIEAPQFSRPEQQPRQFGIPAKADPPIFSYKSDAEIKAHPDYRAAKAGDREAAARLVEAVTKPQTISEAGERFGKDAIYAPVIAQEASGRNKIPEMLAHLYAVSTGAKVDDNIIQANRAFHTGAGPMERMAARPLFDGPVVRGGKYVLVDDVSVLGGSLAELANHIQANGGEVAGVVTLVNASRSGVYAPKSLHTRLVEARFGNEIRQHFGIEPSALTADEASYLANFRNADQLRESVAKARGERDERLRAKGLFPPEADSLDEPQFSRREYTPEEMNRDQVSNLIEAATGNDRGADTGARLLSRIAEAGIRQLKNPNALEVGGEGGYVGTLFPRTMASLDDMSARLWRPWMAREEEGHATTEKLRRVISDSLVALSAESRDRVYAALELARKWDWRPPDDGRPIRVRNTSYWQARKSKVGDDYVLNAAETRAVHDALKLGDEGWKTFMSALARREGWKGALDPDAIRAAANQGGAGLPEGKRLMRLADVIEAAQGAQNRPYFPAMRFGDYYIAVKPKLGTEENSLGGYPAVEWFETVEKPVLHDLLGKSRVAAADMPEVKAALDRIKAVTKPDGSLAFTDDTHDFEVGDLRSRPNILRQINLPAIEKLFMLMERGVTESLRDKIMNTNTPEAGAMGKEAAGIKQEAGEAAKAHYEATLGEAKETLLDAVYHDLLSGWKKHAQLVPGYDADFDRSIGTHLYQVGRNAADIVYRNDIEDAYQNIQDNHPHASAKQYWSHWRQYQDNPQSPLARAAGKTAQLGAAYVMGLNPSTTMMIGAHTPLMATPVLGVGGGMGQATAQMLRAVREVYKELSFDKKKGGFIDTSNLGRTDREKALLADLEKAGLTHSLGADDVRALNDRQAGLWGQAQPTMKKALDIAMSNVSAVDQANRNAIALAAHRMAMNPQTLEKMASVWMEHNAIFRQTVMSEGLTPESFTKFMMSEAAGAWGKTNQAPAMRGAEGSLIFALHGFQTRFLSTAWKLMKNMGPSGRVAAGWMMAALWAGTGIYGLPFTQDLENAGDALWKSLTGTDPMIDAHLRQFLQDAGLGKIGTEILLRGPLSVMTGTDLGSRLGFGDVITRSFTAADLLGTVPTILLDRLKAAYDRERTGQGMASAATELLPSALRNPIRAQIEHGQGTVSAAGNMQRTSGQISTADTVMRSLGLPSLAATEARDRANYVFDLGERDKALHEQTRNAWAEMIMRANLAQQDGDYALAHELSNEASGLLQSYNSQHWQTPLDEKSLRDAIIEHTNPQVYHLMRTPGRLKGEAYRNPY